MLIFCDFIQVYVFTSNHHLKSKEMHTGTSICLFDTDIHETYKQTLLSYKVECKGFSEFCYT